MWRKLGVQPISRTLVTVQQTALPFLAEGDSNKMASIDTSALEKEGDSNKLVTIDTSTLEKEGDSNKMAGIDTNPLEKEGDSNKMANVDTSALEEEGNGSPSEEDKDASEKVQDTSIERRVHSLVHAAQCQETSCSVPSCRKIRLLSKHALRCEVKVDGNCSSCKNLIKLRIYHAKFCQVNKCPLPFCRKLKQSLLKIKLRTGSWRRSINTKKANQRKSEQISSNVSTLETIQPRIDVEQQKNLETNNASHETAAAMETVNTQKTAPALSVESQVGSGKKPGNPITAPKLKVSRTLPPQELSVQLLQAPRLKRMQNIDVTIAEVKETIVKAPEDATNNSNLQKQGKQLQPAPQLESKASNQKAPQLGSQKHKQQAQRSEPIQNKHTQFKTRQQRNIQLQHSGQTHNVANPVPPLWQHNQQMHMGERPHQQMYLGEQPHQQMHMGERPYQQMHMGQGPDHQMHMGHGPDHQMHMGHGPDHQMHMGHGPDPQMYMGHGPDHQMHMGHGPDHQMHMGHGPNQQMHIGQSHLPGQLRHPFDQFRPNSVPPFIQQEAAPEFQPPSQMMQDSPAWQQHPSNVQVSSPRVGFQQQWQSPRYDDYGRVPPNPQDPHQEMSRDMRMANERREKQLQQVYPPPRHPQKPNQASKNPQLEQKRLSRFPEQTQKPSQGKGDDTLDLTDLLPQPPLELLHSLLQKSPNHSSQNPQSLTEHEKALLDILRSNPPLMTVLQSQQSQQQKISEQFLQHSSPKSTKEVASDAVHREMELHKSPQETHQKEQKQDLDHQKLLLESVHRMDMHRGLLLGLEAGILIGLSVHLPSQTVRGGRYSPSRMQANTVVPRLQDQLLKEQQFMTSLLNEQLQIQQRQNAQLQQLRSPAEETQMILPFPEICEGPSDGLPNSFQQCNDSVTQNNNLLLWQESVSSIRRRQRKKAKAKCNFTAKDDSLPDSSKDKSDDPTPVLFLNHRQRQRQRLRLRIREQKQKRLVKKKK